MLFERCSGTVRISVEFQQAFGELAALPAGRGGGWVAARHPERVRLLPVGDARELADVDSREDLAVLEALNAQDADRLDATGSYL